jgi:hypothetical protein
VADTIRDLVATDPSLGEALRTAPLYSTITTKARCPRCMARIDVRIEAEKPGAITVDCPACHATFEARTMEQAFGHLSPLLERHILQLTTITGDIGTAGAMAACYGESHEEALGMIVTLARANRTLQDAIAEEREAHRLAVSIYLRHLDRFLLVVRRSLAVLARRPRTSSRRDRVGAALVREAAKYTGAPYWIMPLESTRDA